MYVGTVLTFVGGGIRALSTLPGLNQHMSQVGLTLPVYLEGGQTESSLSTRMSNSTWAYWARHSQGWATHLQSASPLRWAIRIIECWNLSSCPTGESELVPRFRTSACNWCACHVSPSWHRLWARHLPAICGNYSIHEYRLWCVSATCTGNEWNYGLLKSDVHCKVSNENKRFWRPTSMMYRSWAKSVTSVTCSLWPVLAIWVQPKL